MERFKPAIFYIVFFLFVLTYSSIVNGYDYDFWARLIIGMGFVQTGHVLKHDFLSYTPTHTWFDHEWGSGVIFYLTQHFFSSAGILLLQVILVFLIFFTIIQVIKLRGVKTTTAYNFLFYFAAFHALNIPFHAQIRCQMFSFLLFTVFLYILELARQGKNKPLFLLPLIMILWNNLHGGCVAGIGLIAIYAVGEFLNKAPFKKYIVALFASILVLLINPWGLDYLGFLANAVTMKRPDIMEWMGLFSDYYLKRFMLFKTFALLLLLAELNIISKSFSIKKMDKTKFLVLVATLFLAIRHVKMVPFCAIAAICFLYDDFYTVLNSITNKIIHLLKIAPEFLEGFNRRKDFTVYAFVVFFVLFFLRAKSFEPPLRNSNYPLMEVEFVKINEIKGNLFINFGLGSYASYKLYPNNLIYIDGRYEAVYDNKLMTVMGKFVNASPGWDELLKEYPPEVIIMQKKQPIYVKLQTLKDWKLVYKGTSFGVFVKTKNAKKTYKQPTNDLNYYKKTLFDTNISFKKQ